MNGENETTRFRVVNDFRPQNEQIYLTLKRGDIVKFIRQEYLKAGMAFYFGENERTKKRGAFPPPCVQKIEEEEKQNDERKKIEKNKEQQQNTSMVSVEEDEKIARALVEEELKAERERFEQQKKILEKDWEYARRLQKEEKKHRKKDEQGENQHSTISYFKELVSNVFQAKEEAVEQKEKAKPVIITVNEPPKTNRAKLYEHIPISNTASPTGIETPGERSPQPHHVCSQCSLLLLSSEFSKRQLSLQQEKKCKLCVKQNEEKKKNDVLENKIQTSPPSSIEKPESPMTQQYISIARPVQHDPKDFYSYKPNGHSNNDQIQNPRQQQQLPKPQQVSNQPQQVLNQPQQVSNQLQQVLNQPQQTKPPQSLESQQIPPQQQIHVENQHFIPSYQPIPNQNENQSQQYPYPSHGNRWATPMYYPPGPYNPLSYSGRQMPMGPVNMLSSTLSTSMIASDRLRLKIFYGNDIKRFSVKDPSNMDFSQLVTLIRHPTLTLENASIFYKDMDGDEIVLDETSWQEALVDWELAPNWTLQILWKAK